MAPKKKTPKKKSAKTVDPRTKKWNERLMKLNKRVVAVETLVGITPKVPGTPFFP
jgi:hypothetical protein